MTWKGGALHLMYYLHFKFKSKNSGIIVRPIQQANE